MPQLINLNNFDKLLSFLLYLLPIALITSTFLSDFLISLVSILFIFLALKKNQLFYFKNKLFFFYFMEFIFNF